MAVTLTRDTREFVHDNAAKIITSLARKHCHIIVHDVGNFSGKDNQENSKLRAIEHAVADY